MKRVIFSMGFVMVLSALLLGCNPINYRQLGAVPNKATVHIVTETSGELDYWSNIWAEINRIDGKHTGWFREKGVAYLSPGSHRLQIMAAADFRYEDFDWTKTYTVHYESLRPARYLDSTLNYWTDYRSFGIDVQPNREYDLIVSIDMTMDSGKFTLRLEPRSNS